MEKSKNVLTIILIVIIAILCSVIGWLVGSKFLDAENEIIDNTDTQEKLDNEEDVNVEENFDNQESDTKKLNNYDINSIKNIEIEVPVANSSDPEMKKVTITDKEEIKEILLNVDETKEVGVIPNGIGFQNNVSITINYDGDPSTGIVILNNGNVAINFAVGVGETGYAEYEIDNKNLATELTNKYQ